MQKCDFSNLEVRTNLTFWVYKVVNSLMQATCKVLFGFYLAYSSIKRTVWTGFVMILLNVLYNLILICKQLNVQVSIKRTGSVWNTISTGFFYKCVDFEYLKPFNHNRLEPLYLIWVKNVLENRLSRGYWELSLGSFN